MALQRGEAAGIYQLLDSLGITYRSHKHPPAYGMADLDQITEALGVPFFKNLFLCNRQKTEYYMLMIHGDKRFRTAEVSKKLGKARLSFGEEDMLFQLLGVTPGGVSPLGLVFDPEHRLQLVIDRDLLHMGRAAMHIGNNAESVALEMGDLLERYIPHCGHVPIYIDIDAGGDAQ